MPQDNEVLDVLYLDKLQGVIQEPGWYFRNDKNRLMGPFLTEADAKIALNMSMPDC